MSGNTKNPPRAAEAPTEQTPLLPATAQAEQDATTPLPKLKIALLSLTRFADPMGFSILIPFVNLSV